MARSHVTPGLAIDTTPASPSQVQDGSDQARLDQIRSDQARPGRASFVVETEVRHSCASHSDSAAGHVSQTERPSACLPACLLQLLPCSRWLGIALCAQQLVCSGQSDKWSQGVSQAVG